MTHILIKVKTLACCKQNAKAKPPPPPLELSAARGAQVVSRGEGGPWREVAPAPTEGRGGFLGGSTAGDARVPAAAAAPVAPVAASMVGLPAPESGPQGGPGWRPEPQTGFRACSHTSALLSPVAEVLSECRLLAYISQVPTQMSFLFRLINIIHVQTLTQVRCPADPRYGRELGDGNQLPSSWSPMVDLSHLPLQVYLDPFLGS